MGCAVDGSEAAESMDKDDLVHDMDAVSPRSHEDNLPVSQQRVLKFELQLYKLKDSQYLLDVQVSFTLHGVPLCKHSCCVVPKRCQFALLPSKHQCCSSCHVCLPQKYIPMPMLWHVSWAVRVVQAGPHNVVDIYTAVT